MDDSVIYLDFNASTPCDPRVLKAMAPYYDTVFANPASTTHRAGQKAFSALEDARARTAAAIGARSASEIVFTSGATEANNLVIKGVADTCPDATGHIVTQVTEHASVLEPVRALEKRGWEVTWLGVDGDGRIRLDDLAAAVRPNTTLVSLMLANNETGTVQPVAEATQLVHERGVLVHCDGAQGPGKLGGDLSELGVDFFTLSAHKVYGPKGIGAVFSARQARPRLGCQILGGGQEGAIRSGTVNLPGAAGLAAALVIARSELLQEASRVAILRDLLECRITSNLDGCTVNGAVGGRLPGTSNLSFDGLNGNALLASLPDVAVSSGSACTAAHAEPSHVLRSMGVSRRRAAASLRFSLGRFTTETEIIRAADRVIEEVKRLRAMATRRQ